VNARSFVLGGGVAVTAFVLVVASVVAVVRVDPGAGIIGVALGAVVGGVTFATVAARPRAALGPPGLVEAVAGFGWTLALVLALSYVNAPGARSLSGTDAAALVLLVAVVLGVGAWVRERRVARFR
jgi:hypothetical protein